VGGVGLRRRWPGRTGAQHERPYQGDATLPPHGRSCPA
jgi:hypothetical protein